MFTYFLFMKMFETPCTVFQRYHLGTFMSLAKQNPRRLFTSFHSNERTSFEPWSIHEYLVSNNLWKYAAKISKRQGRVFFIDGTCQNCCDVFFPKFHNNMLILLNSFEHKKNSYRIQLRQKIIIDTREIKFRSFDWF